MERDAPGDTATVFALEALKIEGLKEAEKGGGKRRKRFTLEGEMHT